MNAYTRGYYGKMPSYGDFIGAGLPNAFIDPWDNWQQTLIESAQAELGEKWLETAFTSPIWRFYISPGVCGADAWAGVMMPSVDKVGRYYPLTIAHRVDPQQQQGLLLFADDWFLALETLVLSALETSFDQQQFEERVQNIQPETWLTQIPITETLYPLPEYNEMLAKKGNVNITDTELADITTQTKQTYWSAQNAHYQKTYLLSPNGLPDGSQCRNLFQPTWTTCPGENNHG